MHITCKCLNVTIDTQNSTTKNLDVTSLNLTFAEKNDNFFKEALSVVEHGRISKVQSSLVQVRNVGLWIIHSCLNCSLNTHAIHRDKGAAVVLFSKSLLMNSEEISALKASEKYSRVFRIVINNSGLDAASFQAPSKFAVSQLSTSVQNGLSALHQQLAECIQQETICTEERIRQYSDQQYVALEEFREHAHYDHRVLTRLLCESQEKMVSSEVTQSASLDNLETPPSTPDNHTTPSPLLNSGRSAVETSASVLSFANYASPTFLHDQGDGPNSRRQNSQLSSSLSAVASRTERLAPKSLFGQAEGKKKRGSSLDTEGLFDLEGMEEHSSEVAPSEEESDSDDSGSYDEGIHIPRGKGLHNLANSLPVNVPRFMPQGKKPMQEMDDEELLSQDPVDIAASIKALAKSVHGDANVFGDLPRPRFSTQI